MRLSIFNFRDCFIARTLVAFWGIAFFYYSIVSFIPKDVYGMEQWQDNVLKAQGYAFSEKEYAIVMTGSSELFNVPIEKLSLDAFNLCFSGNGAATGLDLILKKASKPTVVLVEMNRTIAVPTDNSLIEKTSFINCFPWNRENTRPDYLLHHVRLALAEYVKKQINYSRVIDEKTSINRLKAQQEHYATKMGEQEVHGLREGGMNAKIKIDNLLNEGVHVFLVEAPHDISLYDTPRAKQIREVLTAIFPQEQYDWIVVDWKDYVTRDGFHLCKPSGERFAKVLLSRVELNTSTFLNNIP